MAYVNNLESYNFSNYGIGDGIIDGMDGIVDNSTVNSNYMVVNQINKDKYGNL